MGLVAVDWAGLLEGKCGRCCDVRFFFVCFVFEFGGYRPMGVGNFFLSCFLHCFKLQMVKSITPPSPRPL